MATKANLILDQGTTYQATINVASNTGAPLNLSGYTGVSWIKKHSSSINTTAQFVVSINASAGQVTLMMSPNTSGNINPGRYVYDVLVTDSSNNITRIIEGIITITPAISGFISNTVLIQAESNISQTILSNGVIDTANNSEE